MDISKIAPVPTKREQKAFVISSVDSSVEMLNSYLKRESGWCVVNSCGMPSSSAASGSYSFNNIHPTCLVVIERFVPVE